MANKRGKARTGSIVERTVERKDRKSGKVKEKKEVFARVTFLDSTGRRKDRLKRAESRTHARELIQQMLREVDDFGEEALDSKDMTFGDLADYFKEAYLTKAEYDANDKKISGLRSLATPTGFLETLRARFGRRQLLSLTYGDVRAYRKDRLKAPTRGDIARHESALKDDPKAELRSTRTVASVNRELALLRRMFNVAVQQGWIRRNPFNCGDSLISIADEQKRERIITLEEERKLLAACTGKREHLSTIIIAALDTGMRKGELLKLRWRDVDLEDRIITVQAFNTKTMRERVVKMPARLTSELEQLWQASEKDPAALVFGIKDNVKRSFDGSRRAAGLANVRFHDLRHTHATRLIERGIPIAEVARQLGHRQLDTTYRYVNPDLESAQRVADATDAFHAQRIEREAKEAQTSEMVN